MSRDLSHFKKPEMAHNFITGCANIGHTVIITCVDRTYLEQTAYFAQGRKTLNEVNSLRMIAGLDFIGEKENSRKVTWTMNSRHVVNLDDENLNNDLSEAIDFAIVVGKEVIWNVKADVDKDSVPDYLECVRVAEALGFESGMHFKNPDYPHLQLPKEKK